MTKYTATLLSNTIRYKEDLGGLSEMTGKYTLASQTSKVDVLYRFVNGNLTWCLVSLQEGAPEYSQRSSDNLAIGTNFLEKYQAFSGDSALQAMRNILSTVDVKANTTKTSGNLKLTLTVSLSSYSLNWMNTFNGATFSGLGVTFQNGGFISFIDDRSYVQIGSIEVNVSQEQAVTMSLVHAENFSYTFQGQKIENLTVRQNMTAAELLTKSKEKPLLLYPYWKVTCPLENLYPGFVSMVVVEMWADTGKVFDVYPLGIGGGDLPEESSTPQPSAPQSSLTPSAEPSQSSSVSILPNPSTSPEPSAPVSPLLTIQPSSTAPPTASPSLQPADNSGDQKNVDSTLLIAVAAVCAGVVVAVSVAFALGRRLRQV